MQTRFSDVFPLKSGRAHEVTGPGSVAFAAMVCGQANKDTFWFVESWIADELNPNGLSPYCDPKRLLIGRCPSAIDMMASAEDALRSGAVSMVVAELNKPLTLTAGRRLQLAAKAGNATGLFIIPKDAGSNSAETRWHCSATFDQEDSTLHQWQLIKNKSGTLSNWKVRWNGNARCVTVVSQNAKRPYLAQEPR